MISSAAWSACCWKASSSACFLRPVAAMVATEDFAAARDAAAVAAVGIAVAAFPDHGFSCKEKARAARGPLLHSTSSEYQVRETGMPNIFFLVRR